MVALRASVQDLGVGLVEHRKWLLHAGHTPVMCNM